MQAIQTYLNDLKAVDFSVATETSLRTAFENFIINFIQEQQLQGFSVLQEGKRIGKFGIPDFRIFNDGFAIGYIETKKQDENLDKILKTEQIKKYIELSQNLIVTNYLEFIWLKNDVIQRENLCYLSDLDNKKFQLSTEKAQNIEKMLLGFLSQVPQSITTPEVLATALAVRCKNLKDFIQTELTRQSEQNEKERLYDLYDAFRQNIFIELSISAFSDAFAQMLAYGLFLAGLNADTKKISLTTAKDYIPSSFQLIKELIYFLDELEKPEYQPTKWIIDEMIEIINQIEWAELQKNLSFSKNIKDSENFDTDPYIYFYETFLSKYDDALRKAKGVYYTPPQVVHFIVKAINEVLVQTFGLPEGLGDSQKVTVLDFATGTGTFLLEVFKVILEKIPPKNTEKRTHLMREHLLKNLYGFEYLIAPYTIAHLKLSQYLKENGYEFEFNERLQVYLTNTLEPVDKQVRVPFMPQLSRETRTAQAIKDKPILVITGNPPYSGHSENKSAWILQEMKKYLVVDGKPLGERNSKWLQDDYVKFIRFAQDKMDKAEQGVVGIITNHSFLDNLTFRGMRQSLMQSFDQIYLIDLHGNVKKKEKSPDGGKDENVFNIQQGTSISIFVKKAGLKKGIFHTDFWGLRKHKFDLCLQHSLSSISFTELKPNSPFYLFVPQDQQLRSQYEKFWSLKDIFEMSSVGIATSNDDLLIAYTEDELKKRHYEVKKTPFHELKQKYQLTSNFVEKRKKAFEELGNKALEIRKINYRIFDTRFLWWDIDLLERPRESVMKHFEKENIGLLTVRNCQGISVWNHSFVTDKFTDLHVIPIGTYIFPLYRYNGENNGNGNGTDYLFKEANKKDNFTDNFRKFIKQKYKAKPLEKKQITVLEKDVKALEKQKKQVENLIASFESSKELEMLQFQQSILEELRAKIEQKERELNLANQSQNAHYEPAPEDVMGYIYAILHSTHFREKYAEFLKIDFPKIPFTEEFAVFQELAQLGKKLIEVHLLKTQPLLSDAANMGELVGNGDRMVTHIELKQDSNAQTHLYINATQYFENVPSDVYYFQIGGYAVLEKYLKDRKNKTLTFAEMNNITQTIRAIVFTLQTMQQIDKIFTTED